MVSADTAKLMPRAGTDWYSPITEATMPMMAPRWSKIGPPLLPRLMAASVCSKVRPKSG